MGQIGRAEIEFPVLPLFPGLPRPPVPNHSPSAPKTSLDHAPQIPLDAKLPSIFASSPPGPSPISSFSCQPLPILIYCFGVRGLSPSGTDRTISLKGPLPSLF